MKLLFDQTLSFKLASRLADTFPGSTQVRLVGLAEANDATIWRFAAREHLTIVTLDVDFSEMAVLFGQPPRVIWLRYGKQSTDIVEALLRRATGEIAIFGENLDASCLEVY